MFPSLSHLSMKTFVSIIFMVVFIPMSGQDRFFTSNNGFSGTFELVGGNSIKPGSIIIEKFKTSVATFQEIDLIFYDITFPLECFNCSFTIPSKWNANDNLVKGLKGEEVTLIINAAKAYVLDKQENKRYLQLVEKIRREQDIGEQKKIVYSSYHSFYNKERIEYLLDSLTSVHNIYKNQKPTGQIGSNTQVIANIVKLGGKPNDNQLSTTSQITNNKESITVLNDNNSTELTKNEIKIKKLEFKRAAAVKNNDLVLVNEIEHSISRLQKKSGQNKTKNTYVIAEADEKTRENLNKKLIVSETEADETLMLTENSAQDSVDKRIATNAPTLSAESSLLLNFKSSENYKDCESNIIFLEEGIIAQIEASNYKEVEIWRALIKKERKTCKALKKEYKKSHLKSTNKHNRRSLKYPVRQIDSPRIFF